MGIKYCKSCKKPMRAEESVCRTCGTEYKASRAFLILILVIVLASIVGGSWWYFSKKQIEKENAHNAAVAAYVDVLQRIGLSVDDANTIANLKYSEDIQSSKLGFSELKELVASFNDQRELSNKVMRVALAQPISELQKIKRNTEAKKYSGCLEASRLLYVSAMNITNEALLTFLADGDNKGDQITSLFTKSLIQEIEAKKILTECESKLAD